MIPELLKLVVASIVIVPALFIDSEAPEKIIDWALNEER